MWARLAYWAMGIWGGIGGIAYLGAECQQRVEIAAGWRGDQLSWKGRHLSESGLPGCASSSLHFDDLNSYTISAQASWIDVAYYVRLSAEYGSTDKGRLKEHFEFESNAYLDSALDMHTSHPVKRRSEVYDFDGAVGYPLSFFCCRLSVIPLIGFSFHRQHLRVKIERDRSSPFYVSSASPLFSSSYGYRKRYYDEGYDGYYYYPYLSSLSDPFFSDDDYYSDIAEALGLSAPHHTSTYRFTWYGFYVGADLSYALDGCWTLYSELECHLFDRCHGKRKSWTGIEYVDRHHEKTWAYGITGVIGATYTLSSCWYGTLETELKWWQSYGEGDHFRWLSAEARAGLGYAF